MTLCFKGGHDFPIEDEQGAYCPRHGASLIWHAPHDPERPPHPLLEALGGPEEQLRNT
jgi:hypothetical protein